MIFTPNLTWNVIFKFSRPSSGTNYSTSPVTVPKLMLILKVIIGLLLLISQKIIFIFARPSSGTSSVTSSRTSSRTSYRTSPVTVPKLMLILKVIIWFLLLIAHKMSFSYFREPVLETVTVQDLFLFRNLC